ncbi:MAG: type I-E CRISPR-associated protein Cas6/Cse3/CasE [Syntrophomonadaceae bacterium]|jgi:CRISPR system Cascade subunit CasE|nr:type I-E CRISPR-associated protein Cas6/Cse3/CasE [Syntrophomonadaceae bacterium]
MYLSRIELNTRRKNTMAALASPQKLHAAVECSFPSNTDNAFRNLWRIDQLGNTLYLLVLSGGKPDFTHIVEQFGWPGAEQKWETKKYDPLMESIEAGQKWQFRLRANPVHNVKNDVSSGEQPAKRGKVYAHVTAEQQKQWLFERAAKYGFVLNEDSFNVVQREVKKFKRQNNVVTLGIATFEGILEVKDAELFRRSLTDGIGRGKAYGCGLLTVARMSS